MADDDDDLERDDVDDEDQDEIVDEAEDSDADDSGDAGDSDAQDSSDEESSGEEQAKEAEEEEEEITEPDNQDAIVALKDIGARVDSNDKDRVWRVFFYDKHGDDALAQVHGLPALKEVWILGTKISEQMKDRFVEQFPKVKVYYG